MASVKEKMSSRKWIVFCIWTVISIGAMFIKDIPKDIIFQQYGFISLVYIGANAATSFVSTKRNTSGEV